MAFRFLRFHYLKELQNPVKTRFRSFKKKARGPTSCEHAVAGLRRDERKQGDLTMNGYGLSQSKALRYQIQLADTCS